MNAMRVWPDRLPGTVGVQPLSETVQWIGALSLANLCLLPLWHLLLYDSETRYVDPGGDVSAHLCVIPITLLVLTFLLKLIVWTITITRSRSLWWSALLALLVLLVAPANFGRVAIGIAFHGAVGKYVVLAAILFGSLYIAVFSRRFVQIIWWLGCILSPYVAITLLSSAILLLRHPEGQSSSIPKPAVGPMPARRVIWIIFDEWDYEVLFDRRPTGVKLPVLDALIEQSVVATRAYAPAGYTFVSVPALLSGRLIAETRIGPGASLLVRYTGENTWREFSQCETIVSDVASRGMRVTILGWLHPYDRILPKSANIIAKSWGNLGLVGGQGAGLWENVLAQVAFLASLGYPANWQKDVFIEFHEAALAAAADPSIALSILHYSVPHAPGIYDPSANMFTTKRTPAYSGYLDNLPLVDHALGDLLSVLQGAGLADRTVIVLTSDHWCRCAPWTVPGFGYRVPLIIRPTGGGRQVKLDASLCTTSLRCITAEMLDVGVSTTAEMAARLARERTAGPIRYRDRIAEIVEPGSAAAPRIGNAR